MKVIKKNKIMKTNIFKTIFLSVLVISFLSCENDKKEDKQNGGYVIQGKIKDLDSGMVYLENLTDDLKTKDSTRIINGEFTFKGEVEDVKWFSISTSESKRPGNFLLENNSIKYTAYKDSLYDAEIVGATQNKIYQNYYNGPFVKLRQKAGPWYQLADSLRQLDNGKLSENHQKLLDKKMKGINEFHDSLTIKFIENHQDDIASALIIQDRYVQYPNPDMASSLYEKLSPKVKSSYFGNLLSDDLEVYKKTAIGVIAPLFSQKDTNGNIVHLSDYRGNYVLIDFWASWCAPCRRENPNVVKAYEKYHDQGFEVLGISLDSKKDKELWLKAIEKDGLVWTNVSSLNGFKNEAAQLYGIRSIPQNFLIGPKGKIVAKNLRGEVLQKKLAEIFGRISL